MIPAMLHSVFGVTPDELGFSVISMDSAFFEHLAVVFAENRIHRPCAILTDLDKTYSELPDNPANDTLIQAHYRTAEKIGLLRYQKLQTLIKDNQWLQAFFAINTFEVDFYKGGKLVGSCPNAE